MVYIFQDGLFTLTKIHITIPDCFRNTHQEDKVLVFSTYNIYLQDSLIITHQKYSQWFYKHIQIINVQYGSIHIIIVQYGSTYTINVQYTL